MILRAAVLRDPVLEDLAVPIRRCGALLRARDDADAATVREIAANAAANGVEATLADAGADAAGADAAVADAAGAPAVLRVPGEAITDPVAYTRGLIAAAQAGGVEARTSAHVERIARIGDGLALGVGGGGEVTCTVAINCAGLRAD